MTTPRANVGNAGDRKQIKKASQLEKRRAREQNEAFLSTISNMEGRATIWWIIGLCGPLRTPFSPGMDSLQLAFNTGRSDVGRQLYNKLTTEYPDLYLLMQQESIARAKRDASQAPESAAVEAEGAITSDSLGEPEE